jgi:3-(3-hydroxy-phenyl)propionate hydroxylase
VSLYTFRCRRLERFVHDRVVFVGDSAHQVSPFGARGGNGGVQDADNLGWKLAAVIEGRAPAALIHSYNAERVVAADENILHSTRATDFITPKTAAARAYRDAALHLAEHHAFARPFVNSGRLSRPCVAPVDAGDSDDWPGAPPIGSAALDAPVLWEGRPDWLLRRMGGNGFCLLAFGGAAPVLPGIDGVHVAPEAVRDVRGLVARRYAAPDGACILLRPDQHIAARFLRFDAARTLAAIGRAMGHGATLTETAA